jgi:prepilin-type N-terminal cleavage/methylation domain-containing protein
MFANRNKTEIIQNPRARNQGVTLLELILAVLILTIVSVGTISYQYFATRMATRADAEITATRTARLVLDNWKKAGGDENFDPISLNAGFQTTGISNQYLITVNNVPMTLNLAWLDVVYDDVAGVTLRQIQVTVQWRSDYQAQEVRPTDPTYTMTTYIRREG